VAGERALEISVSSGRHIVAGDLHVGIEQELERRGIRIPDQTDRTLERLSKLIEERKPDGLILLGDIKHQVPSADKWEARHVFRLLDALSDMVPVTIVAGNHDGGIARMAPERVRRVSSLVIADTRSGRAGQVGLVHGHAWPPEELMKCDVLVMAHTHPSVLLRDECGRPLTEACWLRARFRKKETKGHYVPPYPELIVMPAFGDLRSGLPVNEGQARLLGPLFRNGLVDLPGARVYLPDGTFLGAVRDLEVERTARRRRGP
jgi:hypothetical protein